MSATKSNRREGETPPSPSLLDQAYGFLSSVKLAIFLLSFIAVSSVFGTLVKQQGRPEEYLSVFSESTYAIIRFLSLDDVFRSTWFLVAIGLFAINLILCSIERLRRTLRARKEVTLPPEKALAAMELSFLSPGKTVDEVAQAVHGYRAVGSDDAGRVLEKGAISRYAVYMIHGSIVLIMIGSLIGLIYGYRGSMTLQKGDSGEAMMLRGPKGGSKPVGFTVKCHEFTVSFYPNGAPKEYVSDLEVIENGKSMLRKKIRVNDPLVYKGTRIYQASYGVNPAFLFDIGGEKVTLSQGSTFQKEKLLIMVVKFENSVHNFGPGLQIAYLEGGEPKIAWFLKDVPRLKERNIQGVNMRLEEIKEEFYTGLEVAYDPGVWVVWTAFALILFGLYVNFFVSYRRLYLLKTPDGVRVAGLPGKNREAFREEFEKLKEKLNAVKP